MTEDEKLRGDLPRMEKEYRVDTYDGERKIGEIFLPSETAARMEFTMQTQLGTNPVLLERDVSDWRVSET